MATAGSHRYIARHAFPEVGQLAGHRDVQGYGVFLDIKNMEYRNAAENKKEEGEEEGEGEPSAAKESDEEDFVFDPDEEVEGVVFSTLQSRFPHLNRELKMAREELLARAEVSGDSSEMKMWKVLDLGLQTVQSITSAASASSSSPAESVMTMNTLLHNFPKHASSLSSVRVHDELKEAVMHYYRSGAMGGIPVNSLFINGLRVDLSAATLNIFDVLSNIRQELKNSDYLTQKGVSADVKKELLRHAAGLSGEGGGNPAASREEQMLDFVRSVKRVDVSKGGKHAIHFLNNLEKDAQYKRLPKSVNTLLQPSWQLTGLARNIYTLVVVVNPVSVEGASMFFQLNQIYEQQYPVRIGVVWACDAALSLAASQNNGASAEDVCRLFGEAKGTYGLKAGTVMSILQDWV
jgi:UDP-glucose:glycoprotein glucosyltransferase